MSEAKYILSLVVTAIVFSFCMLAISEYQKAQAQPETKPVECVVYLHASDKETHKYQGELK